MKRLGNAAWMIRIKQFHASPDQYSSRGMKSLISVMNTFRNRRSGSLKTFFMIGHLHLKWFLTSTDAYFRWICARSAAATFVFVVYWPTIKKTNKTYVKNKKKQVYIGWPNSNQSIPAGYEFPASEELAAEFGSEFFGGNEVYIWFYKKNQDDDDGYKVLVNTKGRLMNATHYRQFLVVDPEDGKDPDEWILRATNARSAFFFPFLFIFVGPCILSHPLYLY